METKEQKVKKAFYLSKSNGKFIDEGAKMLSLSKSGFMNYLIYRFKRGMKRLNIECLKSWIMSRTDMSILNLKGDTSSRRILIENIKREKRINNKIKNRNNETRDN